MSNANDTIKLISKPLPDEPAVFREVFAEVLPVRRTEFYKAKSLGIMPEKTFRVFKYDYNDENRIEYNGKLYALVRAYGLSDREKVELTCAGIELSQKNCKIRILSKSTTLDSAGFATANPKEIAEIYAYKEERSGSEQSSAAGTFPRRTVIFRFEKPGFRLTTDYDIVLDDETYDIQSVIEIVGREEFLEVEAVSRGLYGR